jgi:hypothetical protein
MGTETRGRFPKLTPQERKRIIRLVADSGSTPASRCDHLDRAIAVVAERSAERNLTLPFLCHRVAVVLNASSAAPSSTSSEGRRARLRRDHPELLQIPV